MTNMEEQLQQLINQTPDERLAELRNRAAEERAKELEEKRAYAASFARQLEEDLAEEAAKQSPVQSNATPGMDYIRDNSYVAREQMEEKLKEPLSPPPPPQEIPAVRGLVYLGYNFGGDVAPWVKPLSEALNQNEYVPFSPRDNEYPNLLELAVQQKSCRLVSAVCRFLKLPENLTLPSSSSIIQTSMQRALSEGSTLDLFVFRDLYYLSRSDMIVADLIGEPTPDLIQRLMYARFLDIPVVGIGPAGGYLNPFVQKMCKVVLTDEFNVANIMPLIRAYCSS